ncbi:hypothetical protein C8Q73DRAFT_831656 [Cubamyces lactineus]|nr:hypothetical protein C8Q73DRAFT_831656 [Cubamyces lactineus]
MRDELSRNFSLTAYCSCCPVSILYNPAWLYDDFKQATTNAPLRNTRVSTGNSGHMARFPAHAQNADFVIQGRLEERGGGGGTESKEETDGKYLEKFVKDPSAQQAHGSHVNGLWFEFAAVHGTTDHSVVCRRQSQGQNRRWKSRSYPDRI